MVSLVQVWQAMFVSSADGRCAVSNGLVIGETPANRGRPRRASLRSRRDGEHVVLGQEDFADVVEALAHQRTVSGAGSPGVSPVCSTRK